MTTSIERTIDVVQVAYPQVYLACHTRHQRKRSTEYRLSSRDATILAHLHDERPTTPARLASHLGIARSTMSEALKGLLRHGYLSRAPGHGASVVLTERGRMAIRATSVLETERLRAVLSTVAAADLALIRRALTRLARACREHRTDRKRTDPEAT